MYFMKTTYLFIYLSLFIGAIFMIISNLFRLQLVANEIASQSFVSKKVLNSQRTCSAPSDLTVLISFIAALKRSLQ